MQTETVNGRPPQHRSSGWGIPPLAALGGRSRRRSHRRVSRVPHQFTLPNWELTHRSQPDHHDAAEVRRSEMQR